VYSRGGKLWIDFRYLGQRVREPSGLKDSAANRRLVRRQVDLIIAEIENGAFEFAKRYPHSLNKEKFAELEGQRVTKDPGEVLFVGITCRLTRRQFPKGPTEDPDSETRTRAFAGALAPRAGC